MILRYLLTLELNGIALGAPRILLVRPCVQFDRNGAVQL
jgi:hypothetical protein